MKTLPPLKTDDPDWETEDTTQDELPKPPGTSYGKSVAACRKRDRGIAIGLVAEAFQNRSCVSICL